VCGICGEFNFEHKSVDPKNIKRMSDALIHRGPDDYGTYCDGSIGLGHRRLSIIDLSPNGKQPMWSNDKSLCITFNGEVYNYLEIKKELLVKGYHFDSNTDTEVVINAIQSWGIEKAVLKFIGMFAFAFWDKRGRKVYLCRDRAGIKPLYYYVNDKVLLFASELKAILTHPQFKKRLNHIAMGTYFVAGYIPTPLTIFEDTFKLRPGHYLTIEESGATRLQKYWDLDSIKRNSYQGDFDEAVEELEELLKSAFAYRLIADVPVGLFLSGGIDSSLVSAILKKKVHADIVNITIGFREKNYDESDKARGVSEELGIKHIVHYVNMGEAQDSLLKFCDIYDEPFADTSGIPTYILSRLAREQVKVALSADGGDEQFCGYESYWSYKKDYGLLKRIPLVMRIIISELLERCLPYRRWLSWKTQKLDEISYFPQSIARYEKMLRLLKVSNEADLLLLMNEKGWSKESVKEFLPLGREDIFDQTPLATEQLDGYQDGIMDAMMRTDYKSFLRDDILVKVDRASMFVSLECRDPFLDHRIAEFAYRLPMDYLFFRNGHKRILKQILRKWVSETIISSPKRGFMIPLYYWLKGAWRPVVEEYLSKRKVHSIGFLDVKKVQNELDLFYKFEGLRAEKIWMMLNFQMWAEKWYLSN
jgi:asparagine synthase (glutamine-hydrolysing)